MQKSTVDAVDVVIVGGGAAGLSAAIALGRARRSVVVVDSGEPRNAPAAHMHNYLSRDGMSPKEFLAIGRDEARRYGAHFVDGTAATASRVGAGPFVVELDDGRSVTGRRLLVTTGLVDELPAIDGLRERWGRDVIHCPYCHGWEVRDQRIVVISTGPMGVHQAQLFRQWSSDITLCVHSGPNPTALQREELTSRAIDVVEGDVVSIVIDDDRVIGVELHGGTVVPADAIVVGPQMNARSAVLTSLGLDAVEHPMGFGTQIPCGPMGATEIPGVWVAGNVAEINAQVVHAAGAGTFAGAAINADLIAEDTRQAMDEMHAAHHTAHTSTHSTTETTVFDKKFWDERYSSASSIWSGNPNPQLVAEVAGLAPGRALDIGAGEGADALWLAQQGWTVTAVDISTVALERAAALTATEDAAAVGAHHVETDRHHGMGPAHRCVRPRVLAVHAPAVETAEPVHPALCGGGEARGSAPGRRARHPRPRHDRGTPSPSRPVLLRRRHRSRTRCGLDHRHRRLPTEVDDRPGRRPDHHPRRGPRRSPRRLTRQVRVDGVSRRAGGA